jgi:hypothetical protein
MKIFGISSVSEFLGDFIVYRNLAPAQADLPALEQLHEEAGLSAGVIPRKSQLEYARVIVQILKHARRLDVPGAQIERLVFIGDTRLNDGTAFENLCAVGNWSGLAFIGSEKNDPPRVALDATPAGYPLILANRWTALAEFDGYCLDKGLVIDEATAVVIDLDKTALGARGRNDHVIDQARVQAVENTVSGLLGADFNPEAFRRAYDSLNRVEYHSFTADNQDYLAYICLVLGSGLYRLEKLIADVHAGEMASFFDFIRQVEARKQDLSPALADIHTQIYAAVQAGDPTPFKVFRREEYRATVGRMGKLPGETTLERLIQEEILITQEVRSLALNWRARGALLFGLSDKPDEASFPTPDLAEKGYQPIHRTETHILGAN